MKKYSVLGVLFFLCAGVSFAQSRGTAEVWFFTRLAAPVGVFDKVETPLSDALDKSDRIVKVTDNMVLGTAGSSVGDEHNINLYCAQIGISTLRMASNATQVTSDAQFPWTVPAIEVKGGGTLVGGRLNGDNLHFRTQGTDTTPQLSASELRVADNLAVEDAVIDAEIDINGNEWFGRTSETLTGTASFRRVSAYNAQGEPVTFSNVLMTGALLNTPANPFQGRPTGNLGSNFSTGALGRWTRTHGGTTGSSSSGTHLVPGGKVKTVDL